MVDRRGSGRFLLVMATLLTLAGCSGCDGNKQEKIDTAQMAAPVAENPQQPVEVSNLAPLRILPLGDSITQGDASYQSYRYPLWKKLVDRSANVDLVGSIDTNYNGNPQWPDYMGKQFDRDHEGHWGWKVEEVIDKVDGWLASYTPDIVLMHLGTNDMFRDDDIDETVVELKELVTHLRAANPRVIVFVAEPILANYKVQSLALLRDAIAVSMPGFSTDASPLFLVDQGAGFSVELNTHDGVHPNASGEELMAQKWIDAMIAAGVLN